MQIAAQLEFNGNCRQAFEHYAELFSGEIVVMNAFGDTRDVALPPGSREGLPGTIRFAELRIGDQSILGNDLPLDQYAPPRGFNLTMHIEGTAEARHIFDGLAAGGRVTTPLGWVEWAELFGMVTDRFGVPWLILALES